MKLLFVFFLFVKSSFGPSRDLEVRCFSRIDRRSCYQINACFWHSRGSRCEYVDSWERREGCSVLSEMTECYRLPTCFWHSGKGTCEPLSRWTESCPTTVLSPVNIPATNGGGRPQPQNQNPPPPPTNTNSNSGGGGDTYTRNQHNYNPNQNQGSGPSNNQPGALSQSTCGTYGDKVTCFTHSNCFWDFHRLQCVHLAEELMPHPSPINNQPNGAPRAPEPTACNEIYVELECGRAIFDRVPCQWDFHDESCVILECESRAMQECQQLPVCAWDVAEDKCLDPQFLFVLQNEAPSSSPQESSTKTFLLPLSILSIPLFLCLFEHFRRKRRKSVMVEDILL